MNFELARHNMIEQLIRPWDVIDERVLEQIATIPRESFVPEPWRNQAFADIEIPLGHGQVMMNPGMEAKMLQALAIRPGDRVLEVGTGSGYVTALLAGLAVEVVSVEIDAELKAQAEARLAAQGIVNVILEEGDAAEGWDARGPYNAIAVTGSLPQLNDYLLNNLAEGGRLFAVVGEGINMEAQLVTRLNATEWHTELLFETVLPPLQNVTARRRFVL